MTCNLHSSETENVEDRPKLTIETDDADPITFLSFKSFNSIHGKLIAPNLLKNILLPIGNIESVSVVSVNGQSIKAEIVNRNEIILNNNLSKGVYFINFKLENRKNKFVQSIVIK